MKTASSNSQTPIADVQGYADSRQIAIDRVGIKGLRHPVTFKDRSGKQATIATVAMSVALPHDQKGTHMSRFVALLNEPDAPVSIAGFRALVKEMLTRLNAESGELEMRFPFFVQKTAPVSGIQSMLDFDVTLKGEIKHDNTTVTIKVVAPVTSLCPCSKEISDYGAHNQRSHITIETIVQGVIWIEDLIDTAEAEASAALFGLLKRSDEKFVTEQAYDNPKFVEDVVRDVAAALNTDERISAFSVEVENFESIHNHSAYAQIRREK